MSRPDPNDPRPGRRRTRLETRTLHAGRKSLGACVLCGLEADRAVVGVPLCVHHVRLVRAIAHDAGPIIPKRHPRLRKPWIRSAAA